MDKAAPEVLVAELFRSIFGTTLSIFGSHMFMWRQSSEVLAKGIPRGLGLGLGLGLGSGGWGFVLRSGG